MRFALMAVPLRSGSDFEGNCYADSSQASMARPGRRRSNAQGAGTSGDTLARRRRGATLLPGGGIGGGCEIPGTGGEIAERVSGRGGTGQVQDLGETGRRGSVVDTHARQIGKRAAVAVLCRW